MSNSPDDQPGAQGQGGQPQGGQSQGGQPAGGQPQGGQPQGQYQGGQPPQGGYQTGPGIGDIFSIPETKNEMKIGIVLSVLLSIGFTLVSFGLSTATSGFGGGIGGTSAFALGMLGGLIAAPILGILLGIRQADVLEDQPSNILYANAGVTTFIGSFLLVFLSFTLAYFLAGPGTGYGQVVGRMILPFIITGIAAAIVASGSVWTVENIVPGPTRTKAPQQQQGQPR